MTPSRRIKSWISGASAIECMKTTFLSPLLLGAVEVGREPAALGVADAAHHISEGEVVAARREAVVVLRLQVAVVQGQVILAVIIAGDGVQRYVQLIGRLFDELILGFGVVIGVVARQDGEVDARSSGIDWSER